MDAKCPRCGEELTAEESLAGQEVKCPTCTHEFVLEVPPPPPSPAPKPRPQPAPQPGGLSCPKCGGPLSSRTKRKRASGAGACLFELIGVLLVIFTFFTIIGPIIGILFIVAGHCAAYKKVKLYNCRACRSEFPETTV